jgi:hypothetical protein
LFYDSFDEIAIFHPQSLNLMAILRFKAEKQLKKMWTKFNKNKEETPSSFGVV